MPAIGVGTGSARAESVVRSHARARRRRRRTSAPRPSLPRSFRTEAAQGTGARTPHRDRPRQIARPAPRYELPSTFRSEAARETGARSRPAPPYRLPSTFRSEAAGGGRNQSQRAERYKRTPEYRATLRAVRAHRAGRDAAYAKQMLSSGLLRPAEVRASRLKYLRSSRLRGQALYEHLISEIARNAVIPNTGGGPNLGARGLKGTFRAPRGTAAVLAPKPVHYGDTPEGRAIVADLAMLGVGPFVAGASIGKAGAALARGNTKPAEKLASETLKSIEQTVTHPVKSFEEHPILTPLTFAGGASVAGRVAGAGARGLTRGRVGSTVRPPIALADDPAVARAGGIRERTYSKDLGRQAIQRAVDRVREPVRDAEGDPVAVRQRGRTVRVLKPTTGGVFGRNEHEQLGKLRADFLSGRTNAVERFEREEAGAQMRVQGQPGAATGRLSDRARRTILRDAGRQVRAKGIKGRSARDVVLLAASGAIRTAKTFETDLKSYRDMIAGQLERHESNPKETPYLDKGEVELARNNVKLADRLIVAARKDPKLAERIVAAGEDMGRHLNAREEEALGVGVLSSRPRAERARVIHVAVQHQGARYFRDAELRELERSGQQVREPKAEARYQAAQGKVAAAREAHGKAHDAVRKLEAKRQRLVGAQQSRRGRRQHEGEGGVATKPEQAKLAKLDAQLKAAKQERARARKALRDAEAKASGVRRPPIREALRGPDGRFLSTEAIRQGLRDAGRDPDTVAYVPNRSLGRGAFHARFDQARPVMDKPGTRTGEQFRKGAAEPTAELLREQGVRQATQISKARQIDHLVNDSGLKNPDGKYWMYKEAAEAARRIDPDTREGYPVLTMRNGQRFVPMRAYPAKLKGEALRIVTDELQGPAAMETLHERLLNDRFVRPGDPLTARNVVLVPAAQVERLIEHLRPAGQIQKFFQLLNKPFRMTVLPTLNWLTGNAAEPYIVRLTVNGSGLNVFGLATDWRAASKGIRALERSGDPKARAAARELRGHQFGGLFIGRRGASNRRGLEDFPNLERRYGNIVAKLPVVEQAAELAGLVGRILVSPLNAFFRLNRVIESGAQRAAFGHQLRQDLQEFQGSWLATVRLQEKAVSEAAHGLVNTATQERFMRAQHELLGKYEGFSPTLRAWIQGPMPFLPWALNAARFVYWTMPAHHTALTAVLMQTNNVVSQTWADEHANVPPGNLRYALPDGKGGWIDLARYTPYGLTTAGGVKQALNLAAPQFHGTQKAIEGEDPFGKPLQLDPRENAGETKPTDLQAGGIAAYSLAEAITPYLSTARRLREKGGTAYAGSTVLDPDVKPGTTGRMSAARRTLLPFRPTYLRSQAEAPGAGRGAPRTLDDRIDKALGDVEAVDAKQDELDEKLNRALQNAP